MSRSQQGFGGAGREKEELLLCSVPKSQLGTASLVFQTHPGLLPLWREQLNKAPLLWRISSKMMKLENTKNPNISGSKLRTNSPKLGCEEQSVLSPTDPRDEQQPIKVSAQHPDKHSPSLWQQEQL